MMTTMRILFSEGGEGHVETLEHSWRKMFSLSCFGLGDVDALKLVDDRSTTRTLFNRSCGMM